MNDVFQSIFLGFIQGASEFLPISSSGHLILIPKIFSWNDPGLAFDVALHLGTLLAVLAYFFSDWINIIKKSPLFKPNSIKSISVLQSDLLSIIIISTIPAILSGILLEKYADNYFRNPMLIALTLSTGALILFYSQRAGKGNLHNISLKIAFFIGAAQALAIIPGISRSGITISAALISGLDRVSAARFSFLLSTPIIFGAGIKEAPALIQNGADAGIFTGIIASAISGYLAIKYMIGYLEYKSYDIFIAYRLLLALFLLAMFL